MTLIHGIENSPVVREQAAHNFRQADHELASLVDRTLCWLLSVEWIGMMIAAYVLSPRTWNGIHSSLHPHLKFAILAGPGFIGPTIFIALLYPGRAVTRHAIAIAQILVSILLIDITGGRIETHFHVFGSLAILAFYRDWRVLITASALTALDHLVRGIWWPQSVYGVLTVSPWRWVEHAWWVVFEDFFLILASMRSRAEMRIVATREAQLSSGVFYDYLTGLPNRRLLEQRFASNERENSARAVLFIDLDQFKQVNDSLGHTVGDELLETVASRFSAALQEDQMLARIGGDEFVALIDYVNSPEVARELGARFLAALAEPFEVAGQRLFLSASIGISFSPEHGDSLAELQDRADRAMYIAKSQGRNQCSMFSSDVARRERIRQEISRGLYQALHKNELLVYFQPLIGSGARVTGFETLLRWIHPIQGSIPPSDFIPLAEKSGIIVDIGKWVLREACAHCLSWQAENGDRLRVAVNVSAVQFKEPDFPETVIAILEETGLDPSLLTLELTESVLVSDLGQTRHHLPRLRGLGVRIALDDFGTGYSSLSYLTTLPADTIKLDGSFVNREFAHAPAIVESIIAMAHRIGLRVVAEGVETENQKDRLIGFNCDELQGFYFSEPMPACSVEAFLQSHRRQSQVSETPAAGVIVGAGAVIPTSRNAPSVLISRVSSVILDSKAPDLRTPDCAVGARR